MGHLLTVEVGPLVVMDGSTSLLPLRVTRAADDPVTGEFDTDEYWWGSDIYQPSPGAVRLVDPVGGVVWRSTASKPVDWELAPGGSALGGVPFGAVDAEVVTVMLPRAGFVEVQVVQRDAAESLLGEGVDLDALLEEVGHDPEYDERCGLERFTVALDESSDTRRSQESVTVNVSGDVTFATDSAELSGQADAVLTGVAGQVAAFPDGGTLTITGHTDDVAEEAYNQTLSEQRAQAVADRLGVLADLSAWSVEVSGKGESEPRVDDTTDEARAVNRRVEIVVSPTGGTSQAAPSAGSGALPEAQGPVATGAEGVTVDWPGADGGQVTIRLEQVVRRGGYLFGEVEVTGGTGGSGVALGVWFAPPEGAGGNPRQEEGTWTESLRVCDGLTLVTDHERVYVADYLPPSEEVHISLTELRLTEELEEGRTTTLCAVWPDTGQDTVTLDFGTSDAPGTVHRPWRLTDIPVTTP